MLNELMSAGVHATNTHFGGVAREADLQAMSQEQMAEYERRQGDARNDTLDIPSAALAAWARNTLPARRPTMTLAEYDAKRAAFRPSEEKKDG